MTNPVVPESKRPLLELYVPVGFVRLGDHGWKPHRQPVFVPAAQLIPGTSSPASRGQRRIAHGGLG